jgi:hypothetical protein
VFGLSIKIGWGFDCFLVGNKVLVAVSIYMYRLYSI